jgi:predicted nucleic acid-binding protein
MNVEFIDTNILVYAYDLSAGQKGVIARQLIARLALEESSALSIQVLAEFYSVCTRKARFDSERLERILENFRSWTIHSPDYGDFVKATQYHRKHQIQWWDALLLTSAISLGCSVLWTEDFSHGQRFGNLIIRNPFLHQ